MREKSIVIHVKEEDGRNVMPKEDFYSTHLSMGEKFNEINHRRRRESFEPSRTRFSCTCQELLS